MTEDDLSFNAEVYLVSCSEAYRSTQGNKDALLTVALSPEDQESVNGLISLPEDSYRGKKKTGGKRFRMVMVEIGDDEKPVQQSKDLVAPKREQKDSNVAAMLCRHEKFIGWIANTNPDKAQACKADYHHLSESNEFTPLWSELCPEGRGKQYIYYVCGITSRAQLDTYKSAAHIFHEEIRKPFYEFTQEY